MSTLTIYDRRDVLGTDYPGFDNSPTHLDSAWIQFINNISDNGTVVSSGSSHNYGPYTLTQTATVSLNGHTYNIVLVSDGDEEQAESLSIDGRMVYLWEDIGLLLSDSTLLDGQPLNVRTFSKHDTITGSSMPDIIWGYDGNNVAVRIDTGARRAIHATVFICKDRVLANSTSYNIES